MAEVFVVPGVVVILVVVVGNPTNVLIVIVPIIPLIFAGIYMVDLLVSLIKLRVLSPSHLQSLVLPLARALMLSLIWSLFPKMSTIISLPNSALARPLWLLLPSQVLHQLVFYPPLRIPRLSTLAPLNI